MTLHTPTSSQHSTEPPTPTSQPSLAADNVSDQQNGSAEENSPLAEALSLVHKRLLRHLSNVSSIAKDQDPSELESATADLVSALPVNPFDTWDNGPEEKAISRAFDKWANLAAEKHSNMLLRSNESGQDATQLQSDLILAGHYDRQCGILRSAIRVGDSVFSFASESALEMARGRPRDGNTVRFEAAAGRLEKSTGGEWENDYTLEQKGSLLRDLRTVSAFTPSPESCAQAIYQSLLAREISDSAEG